jgi:hypothetical protein
MKLKYILYVLCIIIFVYISATNIICAFRNPDMTQTQLLLHFPKTITLDFRR